MSVYMSFLARAHMLCKGANLPWESASDMLNPKWMYGVIASQEKDSDISIGLPLSAPPVLWPKLGT